jgi:hypothetical protein
MRKGVHGCIVVVVWCCVRGVAVSIDRSIRPTTIRPYEQTPSGVQQQPTLTGPSPCSSISAAFTSAVVPGVLSTMAVACCVSALRSEDLPAFISPKRPMTGRGTAGAEVEVEVEGERRRRRPRGRRRLVLLRCGVCCGW